MLIEIAERLFISISAVEAHLPHVYAKLSVTSAPNWSAACPDPCSTRRPAHSARRAGASDRCR
ncbi:LuxR C-terminal-related transcriptional regulator [Dactylosporangium sp. NPDC050688]|uniref:LuxR C-terminal-related transcriptional regulator n=1 Tax=Dactylosporangium sp. NPDC050688 TaxID=3157217 RepID=UPI0033C7DE3C